MGTFSSNKLVLGVKGQPLWWLSWSLLIALGMILGGWQWQRAEEKRVHLARLDAAPTLTMPVSSPPEGAEVHLQGHYVAEATRFLDNRVLHGRVGVAVLTPLVDAQGRWWLVERGFVPSGPRRQDPAIDTPAGPVEVSGQWQVAGQNAPLFGPNQEGRRIQRVDLSVWEDASRFAHAGWLHQTAGDGSFAAWWAPNVMPPSRHLGYAVQWWGLAVAAAVVMWLGRRRDAAPRRLLKGETG